MPKLLILDSFSSTSGPGMAVGMGCIKSIRASMPEADITMWSNLAPNDMVWEDSGVKIEQHPWAKRRKSNLLYIVEIAIRALFDFFRCLFYSFAQKFDKTIKHPYEQYDAVIAPFMDGLNDRYGLLPTLRTLTFTFLAEIIIRKPIALIPASVGQLNTGVTRWLSKFVLNRMDVITVRGEVSKEYLRRLGVDKPKIYLAADLGFLLEPASPQRVAEILHLEHITTGDKPIIGLSPGTDEDIGSWAFPEFRSKEERQNGYRELMVRITDYLSQKLDAVVWFIPHSVGQAYRGIPIPSDEVACQKIIERVRDKQSVRLLPSRYMTDEKKGIIGNCDMFISSRMHAAIASTSMGVPTIVIAYGHKFNDVIGGTMAQEDCILSVDNAIFEQALSELKSKVDYVWANRDGIRQKLKERAKIAQERGLFFGKLVKQLVEP